MRPNRKTDLEQQQQQKVKIEAANIEEKMSALFSYWNKHNQGTLITGILLQRWLASSVNLEDNDHRWTGAYLNLPHSYVSGGTCDYAHPNSFVPNCSLLYHGGETSSGWRGNKSTRHSIKASSILLAP